MIELFALFVALLIITLIGHGVWELVAWIFRCLFGGAPEPPATTAKQPSIRDDLDAFRRMHIYLRYLGCLEPADEVRLKELTDRVSGQLQGRAPLGSPVSAAAAATMAATRAATRTAPEPVVAATSFESLSPVEQLPASAEVHAAAFQPQQFDRVLEVATLAATVVPESRPVVTPRRAMSEVLRSFMATYNIRWGELVAGILIVACSIGLVVSLWNTMKETHRLLPATVFLTAVAAIEGAGLYTLKRWRLRHTSLAVLIIATMLVPLSMFAGISVAGSGVGAVSLDEPITWAAIGAGWLCCLGLYLMSGRALVRRPSYVKWVLTLGAPTCLLPLVPGIVRNWGAGATWAMMAVSAIVAIGLALDSQTRLRGESLRNLLAARRKRIILHICMALYALIVLAVMFWLPLHELPHRVTPLVLGLIPAVLTAAGSFSSMRRWTGDGGQRVGVTVAAVLGIAGTLAAFPATLHQFEWVLIWTVCVAISALWAGWMTRQTWMLVLCPVAITVFVPLGMHVWWNHKLWNGAESLWRRYVDGDAAIGLTLVAAITLFAAQLSSKWSANRASKFSTMQQRREVAEPLRWGAYFAGIFALLISIAVGLGPDAWLGNVPRGGMVSMLGMFSILTALLSAKNSNLLGAGESPWRNTTALLATVVLVAVTWCAGLLPMSVWQGNPISQWLKELSFVGLGTALSVGLLSEVRGSTRQQLQEWWATSAMISVLTGLLSPFLFAQHPQTAMLVSGGASLLTLVAAYRGGMPAAVSCSQGISTILAALMALHWFPEIFKYEPAWRSTQAWFLVAAIGGGYALCWDLARGIGFHVNKGLRRVLAGDLVYWERWVGTFATIIFVLAVGWNLFIILTCYVTNRVAVVAPWHAVVMAGLSLAAMFALQGILFGRYSHVVARLRIRSAVQRLLFQTSQSSELLMGGTSWRLCGLLLTAVSLLLMIPTYVFGTEARGIVGIGWLALLGMAASGAIFWWHGRSGGIQHRRQSLESGLLVWTESLLVLFSIVVAICLGPDGLSVTGGHGFWDWSPWHVGGLALTSALLLSLSGSLTGSRIAASLAVLIMPIIAAILTRFYVTIDIGWNLCAAAVSGAMATLVLQECFRRTTINTWLKSWSWPEAKASSEADENQRMVGDPAWEVARVGMVIAIGVAILQVYKVATKDAGEIVPATLWGCLYVVATILLVVRHASSPAGRTGLIALAVGVGSGWCASVMAAWHWIPEADQLWMMSVVWLVCAVLSLLNGIYYRELRGYAIAWTASVGACLISLWQYGFTWHESSVCGIGLVIAFMVGLTMAIRSNDVRLGQMIGQWLTIPVAILGVFYVEAWIKNTNASWVLLVAMWTTVGCCWRFILSDNVVLKRKEVGTQRIPWIDFLLCGGALLVVLPGMAIGLLDVPSTVRGNDPWLVGPSWIATLAILVASSPWRLGRRGTVTLGYWASQCMLVMAVELALPAVWNISSLAMSVSLAAVLAGLWAWSWPILLGWCRGTPMNSLALLDRRGMLRISDELRACFGLTIVVAIVVAVFGILPRVQATSAWLMICSVGGLAAVLGTTASWGVLLGKSDRPQDAMIRKFAVLTFLVAMVLGAMRLEPGTEPAALVVSMRLLVAGIIVIPISLWGLPKLLGLDLQVWKPGLVLGAGCGAALVLISTFAMFGMELALRGTIAIRSLPLALVIGICCVLATGSAMCAILGLLPQAYNRVLPNVSPEKRRWLLYAAQLLGGLTWFHLYLCRPQIAFVGLRPYWPYTVMALAFLSAAIAEWGRRRGDQVVASTLRQSTLYLPLIPVIGFWLASGESKWMYLGDRVSYSVLLVCGSLFYAAMSMVWSKDRAPRVATVVIGNMALWVLLAQQPSFAFATHPQFWLIPPAVCVLAVLHFERGRIQPTVQVAIRYAATLIIYVSSTADILLGEVGGTLWGPMILILLALLGMIAGVVLHTRAFLYLGTFFVLIGVMSMVWHAQRAIDQSWPWWVFGITLGIVILASLMAIEKQKASIRRMADKLALWEA